MPGYRDHGPCGHYTTAVSPFKWMDGYGLVRFLAEAL